MKTTAWTQPMTLAWLESRSTGGEFLLYAGDHRLGQLTRHGCVNGGADVRTDLGSWSVRSKGIWRQTLTVTDRVTGAVMAECTPSWTGGEQTIRWNDGTMYRWRQTSWWSDAFELAGSNGEVILTVAAGTPRRSWRDLFRTNGTMEVRATNIEPARLSLLCGLSWLFLLRFTEIMASAVVVAS